MARDPLEPPPPNTPPTQSLNRSIAQSLNRSFIHLFIAPIIHRPQVYLRDVLSRMVLMMSSSKGGKNPVVLVQKFVENQLLLNDVPFTFRVWTAIGGGRCRYPDDARRHHTPRATLGSGSLDISRTSIRRLEHVAGIRL